MMSGGRATETYGGGRGDMTRSMMSGGRATYGGDMTSP